MPALSLRAELGFLLRMSHSKASRAFAEALEPLAIEGRHFGVLMTLQRRGPLIQSRLTAELRSDKSAMVRTVDDLENLGYVTREPVPGDRRARTVTLTDLGRERLAAGGKLANDMGEVLFARFTEEELLSLRDLLRRFVDEKE
jgi:DNA-binding MarR family transcriptional regulator